MSYNVCDIADDYCEKYGYREWEYDYDEKNFIFYNSCDYIYRKVTREELFEWYNCSVSRSTRNYHSIPKFLPKSKKENKKLTQEQIERNINEHFEKFHKSMEKKKNRWR